MGKQTFYGMSLWVNKYYKNEHMSKHIFYEMSMQVNNHSMNEPMGKQTLLSEVPTSKHSKESTYGQTFTNTLMEIFC